MKASDPVGEKLLAAVYADPPSDAPRRAYARHLEEQGDERGKYINLSLDHARKELRTGRKWLTEALADHWQEWCGPIAPALSSFGLAFERGFLSAGIVGPRGLDLTLYHGTPPMVAPVKSLAALAGEPAWSTVHQLKLFATEPAEEELLASPHLANLRRVENIALRTLARLARGAPRALQEASVYGYAPPDADDLKALHRLKGLPNLRVLHGSWAWLIGQEEPEHFDFLLGGRLFHQLEEFQLSSYAVIHLPAWLEVLRESRSLQRVEFFDAALARDRHGKLARLELIIAGPLPVGTRLMLDALPDGAVTEIVVRAKKGLDRRPDTRKRLRDHADRLGATMRTVKFRRGQ